MDQVDLHRARIQTADPVVGRWLGQVRVLADTFAQRHAQAAVRAERHEVRTFAERGHPTGIIHRQTPLGIDHLERLECVAGQPLQAQEATRGGGEIKGDGEHGDGQALGVMT